jgi:hypothetical protein
MSDRNAPAVGNELFVHNMRALWRNDPELALRVDAVMDDERFALEPTRSGVWTVKVPTADGATTYVHSRYDPVEEAKRLVDSVPLEDKFCFVVSGMGLGFHIRALLDRLKGDAFVLCTEPSIEMLATALTCTDLADAIDSRRLVVLTDDDKTRLHNRLQPLNALMMLGAQFVPHPPSVRVADKAHGVINRAVAEFVTYTRMTLMTLVSNSKITCKNIAMNLVHYVSTPPIDILADRFAGNPGIVISAGPSLSRNIDQLGDLKGRAVLCAVQTAIKPLMKRGIVPDFVTSLDFHEMSQKFFDGAGDLSATHLVAEPKATWHVIDRYPGPVSILGNHWASMVVGYELGGRCGLKAGATVAHLAFYLAVHMGCDPIIFVGQDLAFTGHVFYVPGVEVHQAWRSELNRFNTIEHKEWDRIVRNRPILRRVPAATGGALYTDELLFTYLEQFEKDIADVPRQVVNATEGGAMIRGTESMSLAEAADRFCTEMIDPRRFAYRRDTQWHDPSKLVPTRTELDRRLEELDGVINLCAELLTLFDELRALTHDAAKFNQRLVRVDELRTKVQQESRAYSLVNSFTQLAELRRFSADRRLGAVDSNDVERAEQQIKRDSEFITGVREGAVELKPVLHEARERVREAIDQA